MQRDMVNWKKHVISSPERIAIPIMTHPGITLTGHTVLEAVTHADCHFEAVQAVSNRYPTGAATMIMDLSVEAEAFGAEIRFEEQEVPSVVSRTVDSAESVARLRTPDKRSGRIAERLSALSMAVEHISDRPIFAECIGPLSLAGRLFGVSDTMTAILDEPDTIQMLLRKCTQFLVECCREFKSAGANGVIVAEPVAGMLSPDLCTEFSSNFVRQIVQEVQDRGFIVILHNCGDTDPLVQSMLATGVSSLHFGNKCTLPLALGRADRDVLVMGNIDPVSVLKMGAPDEVLGETSSLLERTAAYRNFVLSSGCDVAPHTPLENVDAFFDALREFNEKGGSRRPSTVVRPR